MTIRSTLSAVYSYGSDYIRFMKSAHLESPKKNRKTSSAHILRISHALEKGMALPNPKPGFGQIKIAQLIEFLGEYCKQYGTDEVSSIGYQTVRQTLNYHNARNCSYPELSTAAEALISRFPSLSNAEAGTRVLKREEVMQSLPNNPEDFFKNRKSIRQFDVREKMNHKKLKEALSLALYAPSVCNRQTGRAYVFYEIKTISKLLKYQDGNVGFGDGAAALIVVTSDISAFYKVGERNQCYTDGGIFAMSIVYALHSFGFGTCMLNWSQPAHKDEKFRKVTGIPNSEAIITMIAVGPLLDETIVASSPRSSLDYSVKINPPLAIEG